MANKVFSIALDGPAGAGKSSIALRLAKRLDASYLDTGAMYRTVALYFLRLNRETDSAFVAENVGNINIKVVFEGDKQIMLLNNEDVTDAIRASNVSMAASGVAKVKEVRQYLVSLQRELAQNVSIIMDGRDIGTKVLPNATLKVFLTASAEERARRRVKQLAEKNVIADYQEVLRDIQARDYSDANRKESPMLKACDAVEVDSSDITPDETVERILVELEKRMGA